MRTKLLKSRRIKCPCNLHELAAHQQNCYTDLQQDPHDNDNIAVYEDRGSKIYSPSFEVKGGELIYPGLSSSEAEHGAESTVERAKAQRGEIAEQRDAHDRVWGTG